MKRNVFLLTSAIFLTTSCAAPRDGSNPYLGAGIGAGIGAFVGQAIGKNTEGTIIGGAIGALAGYVIAAHVVSRNNQVANAAQTRSNLPRQRDNYSQTLLIDNQSIAPSQTLQPGERATVRVQYRILDNQKDIIPYREERSIWYNGQQIQNIGVDEYTLEGGTYESSVDFTLPEGVAKGKYEFRQRITTDSVRKDITVPFTVI